MNKNVEIVALRQTRRIVQLLMKKLIEIRLYHQKILSQQAKCMMDRRIMLQMAM
ncbi:unnamed protein product [Onchocerca flexuosa]|uniref:Transposase n=1 Tax=Onchocerca flexuosa TaxID=387005 RepID=A0A183HWE7_9BILA|nr:unnamed protein product [Onchocerca flexuosa]